MITEQKEEKMKHSVKHYWICILAAMAGMVVLSCGPKPVIKINYQLPATSTALAGINTAVVFEDQRSDASILDKMARHEIRNFTGQFSYNLDMETESRKVGVYDLSTVMEKTLKERLTRMGANVLDAPVGSDPVIAILLKEFNLRFDDRVWIAAIRYEAQLKVDGKVLAREEVAGNGDRVKILGTGDADKLLSSIYSDVINQLNLDKMFKRAELLK